MVKNLPAMQETWVWSLSQEDPQEKEMATQSSILAWKIPWTEEPGQLQSMGRRVGHDWATSLTLSWSLCSNGTKQLKKKDLSVVLLEKSYRWIMALEIFERHHRLSRSYLAERSAPWLPDLCFFSWEWESLMWLYYKKIKIKGRNNPRSMNLVSPRLPWQ